MDTFILTNRGRELQADGWRGVVRSSGDGLTLKLFTNDAGMAVGMGAGDLTEATFGGYGAGHTTYGASSILFTDGDDAAVTLKDGPFDFDCTASPQTVKGWFLIDDNSGNVVAVNKYETPHVLEVGSRHRVYVTMKVGQCG